MATAAQQHEALAAEERLAAAHAESTSTVGSDASQDPDCTRSVPAVRACAMSPGSGPATATRPPVCEVKSLTKKVSPPSERRSPLRRPPRVDVVIATSPRVIAIAPASTRTLLPGGA